MRNFGRITKVKDLISLAQVTEYELKSDVRGTKRRSYHLQKETKEFLKQGNFSTSFHSTTPLILYNFRCN